MALTWRHGGAEVAPQWQRHVSTGRGGARVPRNRRTAAFRRRRGAPTGRGGRGGLRAHLRRERARRSDRRRGERRRRRRGCGGDGVSVELRRGGGEHRVRGVTAMPMVVTARTRQQRRRRNRRRKKLGRRRQELELRRGEEGRGEVGGGVGVGEERGSRCSLL